MKEVTEKSSSGENKLIADRREKLGRLRIGNAFPNDFRRDSLAGELLSAYGERSGSILDKDCITVRVAGRMMAKRIMGKASFIKIQDSSGQIQIYIEKDRVSVEIYQAFKSWDVGDILGVEGELFKTKTGELSIRAEQIRLLVKSLRPMPEKWHGLVDQELKVRQRYVDLIVSDETRRVFQLRTEIIRFLRSSLDTLGFLEVETPMMHPIP
ncbi:MAG: lysine--tRNA ligase, partial [Rhodospirillaceae bacterium]|nr:lysine--tRNA ligase [Rhodospirillaceae bacterium]